MIKICFPYQVKNGYNLAHYIASKLSDYEIGINDLLPDSMHLKYTEAGVTIYPGLNRDTLFMFDNSSNHGLFAEDALLVLQIDMKDGTKKPLLHDKRGLWIKKCDTCKKNKPDPNNLNCCTSYILSAQPDFAAQRLHIQEINNLLKIRCFACCSEQFMSAYELELSGKAANFAVKKYRSHHRIPEQVLEEFAYD
ncbi:4897_t:CDS:2 [Racocetra persica]|uniref:4897_t:CDS:1 n=1 Tax=Racocetra persica TaxID=160502 RepID=A0ACA9L1D3_9GLOM|nr:4897_t:CDS:2 [Racocetra persica]